jgi:membrane protease YdiL (CAAX protease family)
MIHTLSMYWNFLKYPKLTKISKDKGQLLKDFPILMLLDLIIAIIVISTLQILLHFKLIKEYPTRDLFKQFGILITAFLVCIVAPIVEEALFRYQLGKRTLGIYFLSLSLGLIALSYVSSEYAKFFIIIVALLVAIAGDNLIKSLSKVEAYLLWQKLFVWSFYLTAIIFAFAHLSNIKGLTVTDPSFVLYISAQFLIGLSLGYIRLKYGLIYSILFHAVYNGLWTVLMLFGEALLC